MAFVIQLSQPWSERKNYYCQSTLWDYKKNINKQKALGGTQKIGSIEMNNLLNLQMFHDICLNQDHLTIYVFSNSSSSCPIALKSQLHQEFTPSSEKTAIWESKLGLRKTVLEYNSDSTQEIHRKNGELIRL